jgi:hypothetical protein
MIRTKPKDTQLEEIARQAIPSKKAKPVPYLKMEACLMAEKNLR